MRSKHLIATVLVCLIKELLLHQNAATCLRVTNNNNSDRRSPQLDLSGWRTLNLTATTRETQFGNPPGEARASKVDEDEQGTRATDRLKRPLVVQWDDDESLLNDYQGDKLRSSNSKRNSDDDLQGLEEPAQDTKLLKTWSSRLAEKWPILRTSSNRKVAGKLIYHGQLGQNGSTTVVEGARLHISTHGQVAINRRRSPAMERNSFAHKAEEIESRQPGREVVLLKRSDDSSGLQSTRISYEDYKPSGSEWRPIVLASSCAGCNKTTDKSLKHERKDPGLTRTLKVSYQIEDEDEAKMSTKLSSNNKWKPIKVGLSEGSKRQAAGDVEGEDTDSKLDPVGRSQRTAALDDYPSDGSDQFRIPDRHKRPRQGTKSNEAQLHKTANDRWTPVDTTTQSNSFIAVDKEPSATSGSPNLDSAQKSASDLNYIYSSSSQQVAPPAQSDWILGSRQPSYQQQVNYGSNEMQPIPAAIIDTTSGQVPEMITDRVPEPVAPIAVQDFQPPVSYGQSYDNRPYTTSRPYSYESGSYHARPQQAPRAPQQQTTTAPQPIRQEHHYHYYNHQQQQSTERQQPASQQVIRELQPLLISQPVIQQQVAASSTPPPPPQQIIREIIKEVPAQSMQIFGTQLANRVIISPPLPALPTTRELDFGLAYSMPAQRIIRQLSGGGIPSSVVARIPQIRLPIPTIQIPARLAPSPTPAGITRQTGSFIIPPVPQKTTTYLTETQAVPTHTTIMHTTQFTPATRTTVYTTDHQAAPRALAAPAAYKR